VDVLALIVWNSLLATPVLLAAALVLEGPTLLGQALLHLSWKSIAIVLFQAYPATVFGFWAWSHLMHRHPTATVAPFSLLVPVFGMIGGIAFLGEPLAGWKLTAGLLVIGGLALSQLRMPWVMPAKAKTKEELENPSRS
jgi:O-acetylserine/cysteine efflux transporter